MEAKLKMIYWKGEKFWVGELLDHPEIMTQGETLEDLEENMKEAYILMAMEDVPEHHESQGTCPEFMKRKESTKRITAVGCLFVRHGNRHDLYRNPLSGHKENASPPNQALERISHNSAPQHCGGPLLPEIHSASSIR